MYIYITKFKNHSKAFKIGKSNNIAQRLNKLSKTHGEVVYLRYIQCNDENIALNIESIIHNTFNNRESLGYSYGSEPAYVKGEGSTEFFWDSAVIERLDFIENYIKDFGYEMKCAKIQKNKLIDISLKELYELELDYFQWYVHNIHWGEIYNKKGKEYEIDVKITEELQSNKEVKDACIEELIRIDEDLKKDFSFKLSFADEYSPETIAKFDICKKIQFTEGYSRCLYLINEGYPLEQRFIDLFNIDKDVLFELTSNNFKMPKSVNIENKILNELYEKFKLVV